MKEMQIVFLGEEYSFPREVKEYVFYCRRFQEINDNLLSVLTQRIKDRWYDFPDKEFDELLKQEGKKIISCLAQDNIYDITLSELIEQNNGYIYFRNMTQKGFEKWKQISIHAVQEYAKGYENAQSLANAKITGSGITLYSNSVLAHMTFAALESNTIKKQALQADKEYRNVITMLSKKTQTMQEKQENEFLYKELFPAYADVIGMFVSELTEKYLNILYKYSIFDYPKAKAYNLQRSLELLNNLEVVENKEQVLIQAFKNCPYNIEVYKKAIELGLMDLDTFKTIQVFGQGDEIIDYIKSYCNMNLGIEIIEQYISIIAFYENQDEKMIWKSIYANEISYMVGKCQKAKKALMDDIALNEWIRENISNNKEQLLTKTKEDIASKVKEKMSFDYMNELQKAIDIGFISYEEIRVDNSVARSLQDIHSEYCLYLTEKINECIQKVKKNRTEQTRKKTIEIEQDNELIRGNQLNQKEKTIKQKKKITFISLFVIILVIAIIYIFQKNITKTMTDGEKIDKGAEFLGQEIENGFISMSQEFYDFVSDVQLFGYKGSIDYQYTYDSEDTIKSMQWQTKDTYNDTDLDKVIYELKKMYGDYTKSNVSYGGIEQAYQWENTNGFKLIICGINPYREIEIIWVDQ